MEAFLINCAPPAPPELAEAKIQESCVLWFNAMYPALRGQLRCNLQNPRSKQAGSMLVGQGLVAGVSDLELLYLDNKNISRAVFIEMKTKNGRQSPAQKQFQAMVEKIGFEYYICRSLEQFKAVIFKCLKPDKLPFWG